MTIAEIMRTALCVLLVHIGCAAAVLEIIQALFPYVVALDAAKVYPDMRELMNEKRAAAS